MQPPKFLPNRSIDRRVIAFETFCNMVAVCYLEWNFATLNHRRSELCGSVTLSKFGVDLIFPARDIAIL